MFCSAIISLAQIPVGGEQSIEAIQDSSFVFNGPQFFAALVAGVVLALASQLLFTNLGIAAGISLAGGSSSDSASNNDDSGGFGSAVKKIGLAIGLGTLISVSLSLFIASFLAVKLGLFVAPLSGAIVGLVIWATFFSLMVFFSSSAIGSLLGSIISTATSGMQSIVGTATAAFGAGAASKQVVNTAEAAAAAVKKELGMAIDPASMRENVEDFLQTVKPAGLDLNKIAGDFEELLNDENLQEIIDSDSVRNVDRRTFVQLISDRSDISKKDAERIAVKMESVWQKTTGKKAAKSNPVSDLTSYLKSATKEQLTGTDLSGKLDSLLGEMGKSNGSGSNNLVMKAATSFGASSLAKIVMGRADLSDFDVDSIVGKLKQVNEQLGEQTDKAASQLRLKETTASTIKKDVKNYLLDAYPWQLKQSNLDREFHDLIYDSAADPLAVASELKQINRADFVEILKQKGLLSREQIRNTANLLEAIRLEALTTTEAAQSRARNIEVRIEVDEYLTNTPQANFTPEKIQLEFKPILEDYDATSEELNTRLAALDRPTLLKMLELRGDIESVEAAAIAKELIVVRDRVLSDSQQDTSQANAIADRQWLKVQSYLKDTGKGELDPNSIKRELELLLNDPRAGAESLKDRLSHFDRSTLVALLSQRGDISEADVNGVVDQILEVRDNVLGQLQIVQDKIQSVLDRILAKVKAYLNSLDRPELAYEGIRRDVNVMFDDPQAGFDALKDRFSSVDRNTLIAVMSSRDDISKADADRLVSQVERTRDRALQRAERIQNEAVMRLESAKKQAAIQVEETRKAAATASWWLFASALISAIASASAGALGVVG